MASIPTVHARGPGGDRSRSGFVAPKFDPKISSMVMSMFHPSAVQGRFGRFVPERGALRSQGTCSLSLSQGLPRACHIRVFDILHIVIEGCLTLHIL